MTTVGTMGPRPPVEGRIARGGSVSWDCPCRKETLLFRVADVAELPGHAECRFCHRLYEVRDDENVVYQVPDGVPRGGRISLRAAPPVPTREKNLMFHVEPSLLVRSTTPDPFASIVATMDEIDFADVRRWKAVPGRGPQQREVSTIGDPLWPLPGDARADDPDRIAQALRRMAWRIDEKVYDETRLARHVEQVQAAIRLVRERGVFAAAREWADERIRRR